MDDIVEIYADGEPVEIVFGIENRHHIFAQIFPVGKLRYLEVYEQCWDHNSEYMHTEVHHTLKEAEWSIHPDEAAAIYELRDGSKQTLAKYTLLHLEKVESPEQEIEKDRDWALVHKFADEHGLDLTTVDDLCCKRMLELKLEQQRRILYPARRLTGPNTAPLLDAPSH